MLSSTMRAPMAPRRRVSQNSHAICAQLRPAAIGWISAVTTGTPTAITARLSPSAPSSPEPDPRIDPCVGQVHEEVDEDEDERDQQHERLRERVVAVRHRLDEQQS